MSCADQPHAHYVALVDYLDKSGVEKLAESMRIVEGRRDEGKRGLLLLPSANFGATVLDGVLDQIDVHMFCINYQSWYLLTITFFSFRRRFVIYIVTLMATSTAKALYANTTGLYCHLIDTAGVRLDDKSLVDKALVLYMLASLFLLSRAQVRRIWRYLFILNY